ncbi:hypothetical protein C5167_006559 [Papaver somniferum]|uniref:Uncharacterized protein n=1 Tax=Papaver somniferum TaxID=3469 RepID=A0A4Y7JDS4_PAPSO|nr:hypothetical protein C5167_006559 [Papaver somniferum]
METLKYSSMRIMRMKSSMSIGKELLSQVGLVLDLLVQLAITGAKILF